MERIIMHLDMDAFFAAIEERDKPRHRGKPIVVGADPQDGAGRGVVSTANYAARKYGIHSAQPISKAWVLSEQAKSKGKPPAVFLTPRFDAYIKSSQRIMEIIRPMVDILEEASIDEAYADISSLQTYSAAVKRAREMKQLIKEAEHLTCTIGIGPNKLIAKIASGHNKPDGLTLVTPPQVQSFLDPMAIETIPGIGPKTAAKLHVQKVRTIKNLRQLTPEQLTSMFGKWGRGMYDRARGISDSEVTAEYERKSIGEEITFDTDTLDASILIAELVTLAREVGKSALEKQFAFRTVTIKVRFGDFTTVTRSKTLKPEQCAPAMIEHEALNLFLPFLDRRENPHKKKIRLIGVRIH